MKGQHAWDLDFEFPQFKDKIHALRTSNAHFGKLHDEYDQLSREIHKSETRDVLLSEGVEEQLRRKRLAVKDALYNLLSAQAS